MIKLQSCDVTKSKVVGGVKFWMKKSFPRQLKNGSFHYIYLEIDIDISIKSFILVERVIEDQSKMCN